jgi:hypothetical protein
MAFLLQIVAILVIPALALLIGGWIATRIIKMDSGNHIVDW